MKFVKKIYRQHIAVEGQDLNITFGFAKKIDEATYTNMTDMSICRDFLGDAICGMKEQVDKAIYGWFIIQKKHH